MIDKNPRCCGMSLGVLRGLVPRPPPGVLKSRVLHPEQSAISCLHTSCTPPKNFKSPPRDLCCLTRGTAMG